MPHGLAVASSILASQLRGWRGCMALRPAKRQPAQPLELYDIEVSPYCRLVREALCEMDLDVMILPCPVGGTRFRPQAQVLGGKQQFPLLRDPNTGKVLYESLDIAEYVATTYEGRVRIARGVRRKGAIAMSFVASVTRGLRGMRARPSKAPQQPLELYSFEGSPYSRLVREVLCELELPYLLHNTGKARTSDIGPPAMRDKWFKGPKDTSRNRSALLARSGHVQVPYLVDPNTGVEMYESKDIIAYLEKTYAA